MTTLLGRFTPSSPEWHEARRWRIGGSDIGQIMGWSPFGTRDDLLAAKLTGAITPPSPAQLRGALLEPAVLAWGQAKHGYDYDSEMVGSFTHPAFDWALVNPDAVTTDGELVECKTTGDRSTERGWGRAGTDAVPLTYAAQCQWGMGVLDLDVAHLLVLHGATNGRPDLAFSRYIIRRDKQLFNRLLAAGLTFHRELTAARDRTDAAA